ncbi:MAG: hypothetical protein IJ871_07380 [Ruminococcus sp.]|nr:hypothetical protein [Ruminococcus sp.]MBR2304947.1 hypothetical protein [Ruminococcus sp.]
MIVNSFTIVFAHLKRCVSGALATAIGITTLATGASAASSGIAMGYTWNSSVNPTIYTTKYDL